MCDLVFCGKWSQGLRFQFRLQIDRSLQSFQPGNLQHVPLCDPEHLQQLGDGDFMNIAGQVLSVADPPGTASSALPRRGTKLLALYGLC